MGFWVIFKHCHKHHHNVLFIRCMCEHAYAVQHIYSMQVSPLYQSCIFSLQPQRLVLNYGNQGQTPVNVFMFGVSFMAWVLIQRSFCAEICHLFISFIWSGWSVDWVGVDKHSCKAHSGLSCKQREENPIS